MRLSQVKNIFSKVVSFVNSELILADIDGTIIDSNKIELKGSKINTFEYNKDKEIYEKDGYYYIFITKYNSPQFILGIKNDLKTLNIIKLLFDEKKKVMTKENFYRELLIGNISKSEYNDLKSEFYNGEEDEFRVIAFKIENKELKNAKLIIDNIFIFDESIIIDNETIAIITTRKEDEILDLSKKIFSEISTELATKNTIIIGSNVKKLYNINRSLDDVYNVLRLSERFNIKKDVYYYEDFLIPVIVDNIPHNLLIRFNNENLKKYKEIFENKDLLFTAENFFKNNLNITETSEKIFVHRNTLIYRINKIKEISGFDLKKFDEAMRFYMILLIKNMNEK